MPSSFRVVPPLHWALTLVAVAGMAAAAPQNPAIQQVSVDLVNGQMIIAGQNFGSAKPLVLFGSAYLNVTSFSDTQITTEISRSLASGTYQIVVTRQSQPGGSAALGVTVVSSPSADPALKNAVCGLYTLIGQTSPAALACPACNDGIRNGTETDVDCGGSCPQKCAAGKMCSVNSDCQTGNCQAGICSTACLTGSVQGCYTGPAGTLNVGACRAGAQTCVNGVWGACTGQILPATEVCNNIDDDCNGIVDNPPPSGSLCPSGQICSAGACQVPLAAAAPRGPVGYFTPFVSGNR